ncbi:MAG: hypothetical protein WBL61_16685 [Bryobacteraceae bacterium]
MATLTTSPPAVRARLATAAPLLLLYALTGFTGLLAEQGFERYISLLVGATASASAVVLFTYFLGFAVGGFSVARYVKRGQIRYPLKLYGILELLVGAGSVVFTYAFHRLVARLAPWQGLFGSPLGKEAIRFAFGCILVLPVAALMGASFPLIAQALDNTHAGERHWTSAYAANLAGAVIAALLAPFFIMPLLGLQGSMWLCCLICASVFVCTLILPGGGRRAIASSGFSAAAGEPYRGAAFLLLTAAFVSGAVFFALEVIWTHLIGAVLGGSVYSFSSMLLMVLLGLLIGACLVSRRVETGKMVRYSVLFQISALVMLVQFRMWDFAPWAFSGDVNPVFVNFYVREGYRLCVAAVLILPSASVLGLVYPRLLAGTERMGGTDARMAGYMSAANSIGCLTGALLATFILIPLFGSELSLKIVIVILAALWASFSILERSASRPRTMVTVAALAILLVLTASWHWATGRITSGFGQYFGEYVSKPGGSSETPAAAALTTSKIIYAHEAVQGGFTTVVETSTAVGGTVETYRTMKSDGKFLAADDAMDQAQLAIAAVPSLFVQNLDRALLIGLGSGHSADVLRQLGFRHIEIAEFAPDVVEAARCCFRHLNQGVLSDPRVKLHLEDGRNVMLTSPRRYDLITIQINAIWYAGATNVFSREFYQLAHRRLRPGGVLQQWVQVHHIGPQEIACALATAHAVFPHVGLWVYGTQGMMVASDHPLVLDEKRRPELDRCFRSASLVDELYGSVLVAPNNLNRLVNEFHAVINTDHNRWLEYATPRYQSSSLDWFSHNSRMLSRYRN